MGEIKHDNRIKQVNDFTGLRRMRNILPSDIDGFIDYGNEYFLFLEGKHKNAPENEAQDVALKRLCDSTSKPSVLIYFEHSIPASQPVLVKDCIVTKIYFNKKLTEVTEAYTVLQVIENFEKKKVCQ